MTISLESKLIPTLSDPSAGSVWDQSCYQRSYQRTLLVSAQNNTSLIPLLPAWLLWEGDNTRQCWWGLWICLFCWEFWELTSNHIDFSCQQWNMNQNYGDHVRSIRSINISIFAAVLCSVQATFLNPSLSPAQGPSHPSVIFYQLVLSDQRAHPSLLSLVNSVQQLMINIYKLISASDGRLQT